MTAPPDHNPAEDPFHLHRFIDAQADAYEQALKEIKRGLKQSHWMWFIFPQIDGLGSSHTAQFYAIKSAAEAKAYLSHPLLGPRLVECAEVLLHLHGRSAVDIFGYPDDLKLQSSMTLFASVSPPGSVFAQVRSQYYDGKPDPRTLDLLQQSSGPG